jgi:hypothetical protein
MSSLEDMSKWYINVEREYKPENPTLMWTLELLVDHPVELSTQCQMGMFVR